MIDRQEIERIRMVGYARVSTDEERQLYSLENQLEFFREYAANHNYKMVKLYADEGISGKQLKKRDEFLKMLKEAKFDLFDIVVVKDVSRFARNTVDLLTSIRELRSIGINVLFVNNNQQSLGESEFVITLLGAMAQEESANLSKRIQFGKDVTAKRGRVPQKILGYDYIDNYTLKINEDEAALVRRIYAMYLSGHYGMESIAKQLREEHVLTKKGCEYTEAYIRRILINPIYCGELVNHKTQTADFLSGLRKQIPENEQYRHDRPELAIISREEFERVQVIREERMHTQLALGGDTRRRYTSRYLFSGLVRCKGCGCTMVRLNVSRKGSDKVSSYWRCKQGTVVKNAQKCQNKSYIPDYLLRKVLAGELERCVGDKASFAEEVCRSQMERKKSQTIEERLAEKQRALGKTENQKKKLIDLYTNGIIPMEELKSRTEKLTEQINGLKKEVAELNREMKREKNEEQGIETCIFKIEKLLSLENIDNTDLRRVISRIEVDVDKSLRFVFKVSQTKERVVSLY